MSSGTDDIRIQLRLNLETASAPIDLAKVLLARPASVGACRVNLMSTVTVHLAAVLRAIGEAVIPQYGHEPGTRPRSPRRP